MFTQSDTQKNSPTAIIPAIRPKMPWRVVSVQPLDDFRLHVCFVDGLEGEVEMKELIHSPAAGVFALLAESFLFAQARVVQGAVTWPGEIDLAPDAMYAEIKKTGKWVLQ